SALIKPQGHIAIRGRCAQLNLMAKQRIKIPSATEKKILYDSARTCNVCKIIRKGIQIHHIDQDPSNNKSENLMVLCQDCHDEAHTKHFMSKNLTAEKLTYFKKEWEKEIAERSAAAMLPNNNLDQAIWTFINHQKIGRILNSHGVKFNQTLKSQLESTDVIDSFGIPILKKVQEKKTHQTIYDYFEWDESLRLHTMYMDAIDDLIMKVKPLELGAIWSKTEIKAMVKPGSYLFSLRGYYFKTGEITENEEDRIVYARSKNVELRWYANTRHMYGSSALYDSFSGHRFAAALLLVKSLSTEGNLLVIHCTPLAMGAGFIDETYKSPHTLKYGWNRNYN
ncbi:MAG: HNH endonuclease, partial [Reichenbachiella sp.]